MTGAEGTRGQGWRQIGAVHITVGFVNYYKNFGGLFLKVI